MNKQNEHDLTVQERLTYAERLYKWYESKKKYEKLQSVLTRKNQTNLFDNTKGELCAQ